MLEALSCTHLYILLKYFSFESIIASKIFMRLTSYNHLTLVMCAAISNHMLSEMGLLTPLKKHANETNWPPGGSTCSAWSAGLQPSGLTSYYLTPITYLTGYLNTRMFKMQQWKQHKVSWGAASCFLNLACIFPKPCAFSDHLAEHLSEMTSKKIWGHSTVKQARCQGGTMAWLRGAGESRRAECFRHGAHWRCLSRAGRPRQRQHRPVATLHHHNGSLIAIMEVTSWNVPTADKGPLTVSAHEWQQHILILFNLPRCQTVTEADVWAHSSTVSCTLICPDGKWAYCMWGSLGFMVVNGKLKWGFTAKGIYSGVDDLSGTGVWFSLDYHKHAEGVKG